LLVFTPLHLNDHASIIFLRSLRVQPFVRPALLTGCRANEGLDTGHASAPIFIARLLAWPHTLRANVTTQVAWHGPAPGGGEGQCDRQNTAL